MKNTNCFSSPRKKSTNERVKFHVITPKNKRDVSVLYQNDPETDMKRNFHDYQTHCKSKIELVLTQAVFDFFNALTIA